MRRIVTILPVVPVVPALLTHLILLSCGSRVPRSLGPLREVTVITDYWNEIGETVEGMLGQPVRTPQPEPEFRIRVGSFERFGALSRLRLVLVIGTSGDTLLRRIIGQRIDSLPDGDFGLFKIPNAWVENQWVLVFVARERELLLPGLKLYSRRIRNTLTDLALEQMNRASYLRGVNKELTGKLGEHFGWTIDVPQKWLLEDKDSASNFIYIFGHFPDRSVFVHWSDTVRELNLDSILSLRDRLTGSFYNGDSVDRSEVMVDTIDFLGVPALRVRGVWQNQKEVIGGPFVLYAFNYQNRFFMLDGVVYNPGEKKLSNLLQVEGIIRTFVPGYTTVRL